ncbi:MAG: thioredoxin family protein, partial [Planctomycetota bacterium]
SILLLVWFGLSTSVGWGAKPESIDWVDEYSAARRAGIAQDRPVLLFVTTDGCTHCDRMIDGTFQDANVIDALADDFVPAQIKLSPADELAKQLKVTLFPTTIIISTEGKILDYARGYLSANQLHQRLDAAATVRIASAE